jgi:hypothetical protein
MAIVAAIGKVACIPSAVLEDKRTGTVKAISI